jgi:uncharacterized protein (DUF2141 family)
MKTAIIFTLCLLFSNFVSAQDKGQLTVSFENYEEPQGVIYIAVFEKDNFLRQPKETSMLKVKAEGNQVTFEDLAYGEYAVSVFHDLNDNKQFDMDENQIPAEPWAMSGTVNPMQMPTWESAKFEFKAEEQEVSLKLFK